MMHEHEDWQPTPEQLVAFADGELDADRALAVARWLAIHPKAAAEVDAHIELTELWRDTLPPDPTESAWYAARLRVQRRRQVVRVRRIAGTLRSRVAAAAMVAAAGILAVALVGRMRVPPVVSADRTNDPYPVVSGSDVEITSISPADDRALVVGMSPAREPFVPARGPDVLVNRVYPDSDGQVATVRISLDKDSVPIAWPVLRRDRDR
jgi:anti-sigma factor RsiW